MNLDLCMCLLHVTICDSVHTCDSMCELLLSVYLHCCDCDCVSVLRLLRRLSESAGVNHSPWTYICSVCFSHWAQPCDTMEPSIDVVPALRDHCVTGVDEALNKHPLCCDLFKGSTGSCRNIQEEDFLEEVVFKLCPV